ncbi:UNVERIFIED_ORG: hypothetical protein M2414_004092 [Rahnella aquatilis]|nr:hypothetical protein [uncultured Rahnella sp.]
MKGNIVLHYLIKILQVGCYIYFARSLGILLPEIINPTFDNEVLIMKVSRIAALLFISFTGLSRAAEPLHHFNTSSVDHLIILAGDGGAGGD